MAFNTKFFMDMAPQRYWQPDKEMGIEADILANPSKYNQYIGSFKKDGEWSKMIWDGNTVSILSRSISKKTGEYAHKEDSLPHLVNVFKALPAGTVLLGEICYDELFKRSKDVGTILRCIPEKAIERQENEVDKLHFYVFDVLAYNGVELLNESFEKRIEYIPEVAKIISGEYIRFAEFKTVEQIVTEYENYLAQGGEGFVLQKKTAPYTPGKRPAWQTIKLKKFTEEFEAPVIGFIEPEMEYTGKELENWEYFKDGMAVTKYYYKGWKAGVVINLNGVACNIASGITDADAEWLATDEAKKYLAEGRIYAKCSAMEVEKDTGKLRHGTLKELRTDL